jgi:hypothetical protein
MNENKPVERHLKKLPGFQRQAVERLLAQAKPVKTVPSVAHQWLLWMVLSTVAAVVGVAVLGPQPGLGMRLSQLPSGGFLVLVFLGSALAAWAGIASSMPGSEPKSAQRSLMGAVLLLLLAMPFLFFTKDDLGAVWAHGMESGWFCFRTTLLIAAPAWVFLGWLVARNASFHPVWTAAWLSVSASLLGTGVVQVHCVHWESYHVVVDHLLPMAIFIFLPLWVGSYWFSRWRK